MKTGGTDTHTSLGFTIIEVMIVLAVTAALFVPAAMYLSGKQAKTEFQVGAQQLQQQLQQVISDVQNGYYQGGSTLSCSVPGSSVVITGTGGTQGTNKDCIFVGKVLLFGGSGNAASQYKVFSLAGKRLSSGRDVSSVAEAAPVAIAPTPTNVNIPDLTDVRTLPNGLTFVGAQWDNASGYNSASSVYTAAAIISDFSPLSAGATMQTGGAQNFSLHGFGGGGWVVSASNTTTAQQANLINTEAGTGSPYPAPSTKVRYCFASGGTNQSVLVTMTVGLQVSSEIKSGTTCGL